MKRFLALCFFSAAMACGLTAQNADSAAILQKIYETNKKVATLQAPYQHTRHGLSTSERYGNFYYVAANRQLAMRYTSPSGRYFIVSNNMLHNKIGAVAMHFDIRNSELMRLFGNCMVWAVRGDVKSIYDNNNVSMTVASDDKEDCYIITMTACTGFNKGISRIMLKYDRATCLIFYMEVDEVIGVNHVFSIGRNPTKNEPIEPSHFEI